jgi:5-methylcytosine-specific restriction endonuclease McrA
MCNSCSVNKRRFSLRFKIVEYMGGKCVKCGYDKTYRALHAHHINPAEKGFNISGAHARSWEAIKTELSKCILLCANCHSEIHREMESERAYRIV